MLDDHVNETVEPGDRHREIHRVVPHVQTNVPGKEVGDGGDECDDVLPGVVVHNAHCSIARTESPMNILG